MSKRLKNKKSERQVLSKGQTSGQRVVYGKDSFDRFGDDLTEEVLQYLTFSDKVRLECVSKQWQRCIFQRQFVIELKYPDLKPQNSLNQMIVWKEVGRCRTKKRRKTIETSALESVLKKCPNITTIGISVYMYGIDLSLFGQNCPKLKALKLDKNYLKDFGVLEFGERYGHQLQELEISDISYDYQQTKMIKFLKLCYNLKNIKVLNRQTFIKDDNNFLPNLEVIEKVH